MRRRIPLAALVLCSIPRNVYDSPGCAPLPSSSAFDLDDDVYEGASGFLLKDAPRAGLAAAVPVAAAGDALLAPWVTRRLIEAFAARPAGVSPAPSRLA